MSNFITRPNAEKAKAFDRLHEKTKNLMRQTNIPECKNAYQRVLDAFTVELITMGLYDRCSICGKPLNWEVAKWAFKKGIHWFCGTHYQSEEKTNETIKKHKRSFKYLVAKLEREKNEHA